MSRFQGITMKIKTFTGNFFEIGKQQGCIYSKNGMDLKNVKINAKLFQNQLEAYKKYYPELLEEFRGVSEAGDFDKNKLTYNFVAGEILRFTKLFKLGKACTIFGVKNKNGVFVGRNYDWHPATEKVFQIYKIINPQRNSFIALSDMGISGEFGTKPQYLSYEADDTINDKGLFIGLTFAYNDKWSYGLSCTHMIKLIAETCETVEDTIQVFKKIPLCCPKNFFIADINGNMAVVEHTSNRRFKVLYPNDDILIQTNHYADPDLAEEDKVLVKRPAHNTFSRYYETLQKVNEHKENFKLSDVIKILGNIESCICQNHLDIRTIWTLALDMEKKKYNLYWNILGKRQEKVLKI